VRKAQGGTFGRAVAQLEKANLLSQDLAAEFARLLAERNWLAHWGEEGESLATVLANALGQARPGLSRRIRRLTGWSNNPK
jgi:uncharacterized protein YutE (UPF0331/DUF86 family)